MKKENKFNEWLTNQEAAEYARLSNMTLFKMRRSGELPYYRIGSKVLIRRADLDGVLNQKREAPELATPQD